MRDSGYRLALPAVLLLALLVRLYRLDALSFWLDEVATLRFAHGSIFTIWGEDTHPPLYYALISGWRLLGESEYALRLSSVLLSLGSVAALHAAGVALGGRLTGLLAGVLLALSPMALQFAQELRMYALLECSVALGLLGLVRLLRDPAAVAATPLLGATADRAGARQVRWSWALYGLGSVLALYSHNMGFLWPLAANVAVPLAWWPAPARWRLARRWLTVNAGVLALWALYWPALRAQAERVIGDFWMQQPTANDALGQLGYLDLGLGPWFDGLELALAALFLALAGLGLAALRSRALVLLLLIACLLPPLVEFGLVLVARPLFASKSIIWTALPFLLAMARGLAWLLEAARRRRARPWLVAALGLVVAVVAVRGAMLNNYSGRWHKADWRGSVATLSLLARPDDRILLHPFFEVVSFNHYAARQSLAGRPELPADREGTSSLDRVAAVARSLVPGDRLWLVRSLWYYDALRDAEALVSQARPCLRHAQALSFTGIDLDLYEAGDDCAAAP